MIDCSKFDIFKLLEDENVVDDNESNYKDEKRFKEILQEIVSNYGYVDKKAQKRSDCSGCIKRIKELIKEASGLGFSDDEINNAINERIGIK